MARFMLVFRSFNFVIEFHMKTFKKITLATFVYLAGFAANANLVINGDFETGNFSGWTKSGNTSLSDVIANSVTSNHTFVWRSGATGSQASISQTLATVADQHLTLSFDLYSQGTSNVKFDVFFDGALVYSLVNTAIAWTHFEFNDLIATDASTELRFASRNDPSFTRLDNVNVIVTNSGSVPEPGSLALVGLALAGLGLTLRKAKQA